MRKWIQLNFLWNFFLGLAGLVSVVFGGVMTYKSHFEHPQLSYIPTDTTWREHLDQLVALAKQDIAPSASPSNSLVEVSGAVSNPGVFSLSPGARVQDAILQAGGFVETAHQQYIHQELQLAAKVSDQQKIYIPFEGEGNLGSFVRDTISVQEEVGRRGAKSLNQATQKELESVSGIGEKRASDILEGMPYTSWSDLEMRVSVPTNILTELKEIYAF